MTSWPSLARRRHGLVEIGAVGREGEGHGWRKAGDGAGRGARADAEAGDEERDSRPGLRAACRRHGRAGIDAPGLGAVRADLRQEPVPAPFDEAGVGRRRKLSVLGFRDPDDHRARRGGAVRAHDRHAGGVLDLGGAAARRLGDRGEAAASQRPQPPAPVAVPAARSHDRVRLAGERVVDDEDVGGKAAEERDDEAGKDRRHRYPPAAEPVGAGVEAEGLRQIVGRDVHENPPPAPRAWRRDGRSRIERPAASSDTAGHRGYQSLKARAAQFGTLFPVAAEAPFLHAAQVVEGGDQLLVLRRIRSACRPTSRPSRPCRS